MEGKDEQKAKNKQKVQNNKKRNKSKEEQEFLSSYHPEDYERP